MTNSLKNKLCLHIFIILKKSQQIVLYIFACILDLITNLLISLELGLYFKNIKKNYLVLF